MKQVNIIFSVSSSYFYNNRLVQQIFSWATIFVRNKQPEFECSFGNHAFCINDSFINILYASDFFVVWEITGKNPWQIAGIKIKILKMCIADGMVQRFFRINDQLIGVCMSNYFL